MPTRKPRVQVTLEPRVHETIKRLAEFQGRSRGSVIAELLTEIHLPLMRTLALLEAAAEAPKQVTLGLKRTLEKLEGDLKQSLGDAYVQIDDLLDVMRKGEADPRHGNTGVRSSEGGGNG